MDVFSLRDSVIRNYGEYVRSFVRVREPRLQKFVDRCLADETLWPQPMLQVNPSFAPGGWVDELVREGVLHEQCRDIFRIKSETDPAGRAMRLHRHQVDAIRVAGSRENYVLTTGTGSGKSLAYIVPIVNHVLRTGRGRSVKAIVVYPMNALCNSQHGELEKYLRLGFGDGNEPVRFEKYTGQESPEKRDEILRNPPDVLLTNYVMLELMLTRPYEGPLVDAARGLSFLVLDELHTYRGRQGADVALLVRRLRERCQSPNMLCIGTSATMASGGTYDEQRAEIASVATRLFGAPVLPENVIGETLTRSTPEHDFDALEVKARLVRDITAAEPPETYADFVSTAMAGWLESRFGLAREEETDRLIRARPSSISGADGAASALSALTSLDQITCEAAIEEWLLAGCACEPDPQTGQRPFAFRLHQFISRGDTVFASPEPPDERHLSVSGQPYVTKAGTQRHLLPLAFCRECGADYYAVWKTVDEGTGRVRFGRRDLGDRLDDPDEGEAGFLHHNPDQPWPDDPEEAVNRLPDDWIEIHRNRPRVKSSYRDHLPQIILVKPDGEVGTGGTPFTFTPTPFRFCQCCGVSYRVRRGASDYGALGTLASGGRSTATTILSISTVQLLREDPALDPIARKLLSFTDNRQDASLQAGHFNDFVEVALLRSALLGAVDRAGTEGLSHDELTQHVFRALALPIELYAREPGVQFAQKAETERAFRNVLGYRLYRDQKRGWRVTSPNLEQCGLLQIDYPSLDELCRSEEHWQDCHAALTGAAPETRERICRVLLDYLRRELAIDVEYLSDDFFERLKLQSSQRLREPWAIDELERFESPPVVFPRGRQPGDTRNYAYLSGRSGFGIYLGRRTTLPEWHAVNTGLPLADKDEIIHQLFRVLAGAGYVSCIVESPEDGIHGYQIAASAMMWCVADGTVAFHDPIRVPNPPEDGGRTNEFFIELYRNAARRIHGLEAREHTAQVPYDERERREGRFGKAELPILYCSPTMELGVDIRQLNVVNMRNVPPTPANYAQRSGRAGRGGQPALVITYCTSGSSHDRYFFSRPERMVAGAVSPPRLDLANEDLVRAHVHAVWLAATGAPLGNSLTELLDVQGADPSLELLPGKLAELSRSGAVAEARRAAGAILDSISEELASTSWYTPDWLANTLDHVMHAFEDACDRWRGLFRAAKRQREYQNSVIGDVARRQQWDEAKRLRRESEAQMELLTDAENVSQSDFYSYRYFASEGFLPGYSFPRLPLSAFIPARRRMRGQDEFLSRPRFLAISEFGPRSIIYHEGSRYVVNKVILPVAGDDGEPLTTVVKQCVDCGYVHELRAGQAGPDLCENCSSPRLARIDSLLRLQNVATKRRDRISSDEEERLRMGYEIRTGLRFQEEHGIPRARTGAVDVPEGVDLGLTYGDAATIWRINLGWRRRANRDQHGFILDVEKGYWQRRDQLPDNEDPGDPLGPRTERVVPFVEDRRNCLVIEPAQTLSQPVMASLQAALKKAIQAVYQLEDNELAAEPLPSEDDRRRILLFESAEGGAGVLRRLLDEPASFAEIAREALRICHFNPETGEDEQSADDSTEICESACYDCLMSYGNQRDHQLLDRRLISEQLMGLTASGVQSSPNALSYSAHLAELRSRCDSRLELQWLDHLVGHGLRLPTAAQLFHESAGTRPDFSYAKQHTVIYVDGPPHDYPDRQQRDADRTAALEDRGITVLRFHHADDWNEIFARHPNIFGTLRGPGGAREPYPDPTQDDLSEPAPQSSLDLDLFPGEWREIASTLAGQGEWTIEPGGDVTINGRVAGSYVLEVIQGDRRLRVFDARMADRNLLEAARDGGAETIAVDPGDPNALDQITGGLA